MTGLKRKHHGELNKVIGVPAWRYDQLRAEYADDPVALQEIDTYDPTSKYARKIKEYRDALLDNLTGKAEQLEIWFSEHYPDIPGTR